VRRVPSDLRKALKLKRDLGKLSSQKPRRIQNPGGGRRVSQSMRGGEKKRRRGEGNGNRTRNQEGQGTKEGEGNGTELGHFFAPIKKQSFERDLGTFVSIT
jgi:hypothetical protein